MPRSARPLLLPVVAVFLVGCTTGIAPSPDTAASRGAAPSTRPSPTPATLSESAKPTNDPSEPTPAAAVVGHWLDCRDGETVCDIHSTQDGVEPAGWPVVIDGPCRELRTGRSGLAYVGCTPSDGAAVHVIGLDGQPVDGWPLQIAGTIASVGWHDFSIGCGVGSAVDVGLDGAVYVAVASARSADLHVFEPNGTPRAGWPQSIPGDPPTSDGFGGNGCRGFALGVDGVIVAWGYQGIDMGIELAAKRTEFIAWSADGRVRPGWPRGSVGAASGPVLDDRGGISYVSASGRVWSHDAAGDIRRGWPYQLSRPAPPRLAPDGRIAVVVEVGEDLDRLVLLRPTGQLVGTEPIELPADIETQCLFGDTPCAGMIGPVFAADGTIYLSLAFSTTEHVIPDTSDMGGALVAIDTNGRIVDGWPVDLAPRTHILGLSIDGEGQLVARGVVCGVGYCGGDGTVPTVLTFSSGGKLLDQQFENS